MADEQIREKREKEEYYRKQFMQFDVDVSKGFGTVFPFEGSRTTNFMKTHSEWSGLCKVELEPTPEKSSAKPKPYFETFDTGELVYKTSASRREYVAMYELVGGTCYCHFELFEAEDSFLYMRLMCAPPRNLESENQQYRVSLPVER